MLRRLIAAVTAFAFMVTGGGGPAVSRVLAAAEIGGDSAGHVRLTGHVLPALARAARLPSPWYASLVSAVTDSATGTPLTITVILKRADQEGFDRYLREVYDPKSPSHRRFLSQAELTRRFGPSQSAHDKVLGHLERAGLALVERSKNRLTITVRGTRTQAERAFAVRISDFQLDGRTFYANEQDPALPAHIARDVLAVVGLSNLAQPRANTSLFLLQLLGAGTEAEAALLIAEVAALGGAIAVTAAVVVGIVLVALLIYMLVSSSPGGGPPGGPGALAAAASRAPTDRAPHGLLASAAADGTGQTIGLLQFDTFRPSDVSDLLTVTGLPASWANRVHSVEVGGSMTPGPNQAEVLIDVIAALVVAQGAEVVVYSAPFRGAGASFQTLFNRMIDDGVTVVSNSWAYCEDQTTLADVQSIDSILASAAASGISVFNASGDTGSTCLDGAANTVAVPASSPHATAVGGTSLSLDRGFTSQGERWWDGVAATPPTGQGGFGVSRFFARPAYQDGLPVGAMRSVPDVVAPADPRGGIGICQADAGGCPTGLLYGGTSIAAPLWAAMTARLNQAVGQDLGLLNEVLYPLASSTPEAFHSASDMGSNFAHVGLGSPRLNRISLALRNGTPGSTSATQSRLVATPSAPADGASEALVVAFLRDADGNFLTGRTVALAATPGTHATITPLKPVTTLDEGAAVFAVKNLVAESVTFTATDGSAQLAETVTVSFLHPPATAGGISASPTTVVADGIATTTITVTLQDALGRGAVGKRVALSQGNGHSLITAPGPSVTDANGEIRFTATNLVNEAVTYKATDVSDGDLAVPGQAVVTFSNGSGTACGQTLPVPVGLNGYTVTPFATAFATGPLFFSNVNYGGCSGVAPPAFLGGSLFAPNFLNGDLFKLEPTGGVVSNANKLSTLGPTLGWLVVGKDGRLYGVRSGTGSGFSSGIVIELDPATGAIIRTLASGLTCPAGLAVDPLSGDLFFIDQCFGAGSDNPSLFRVKNPSSANPTLVTYATLPSTPNGQVVFSPKGTIYTVSNYLLASPMVVRVSGTNGPNPPTVTPLAGLSSNYWINIAAVGPDGEATVLITLNNGKLRLVDISTNPPSVIADLSENVGGGIIGPDGCLYMPNATAIYRLTDPSGGCSFLATNAAPLLVLSPTAVAPNPPQGSAQTFTASFRNVNMPAGTPVFFQVTGANAQFKLARTDASGKAAFAYTAGAAGPDAIVATATIEGSTLFSNAAQVTWTAGRHVTFLTLNQSPTTGIPGAPVTVTAALADVSQEPPVRVSGAAVSFGLAGDGCNGVTDADGIARCELTPTGAPGVRTLSASFGGGAQLTGSTASVPFMLVAPAPSRLAGVGPAHVWVGLKNSDDQGTQFDVRVRVMAGTVVLAEGRTLCVTGVTRNPGSAREVVVPLELLPNGTAPTEDSLRVEVAARVGTTPGGARCGGPGGSHASAKGLRAYYDARNSPSRLALQMPLGPLTELYLDSNGGVCQNLPGTGATDFFLDAGAPTAAQPKCRDSGTVNYGRGNPWQVIGSWRLPSP